MKKVARSDGWLEWVSLWEQVYLGFTQLKQVKRIVSMRKWELVACSIWTQQAISFTRATVDSTTSSLDLALRFLQPNNIKSTTSWNRKHTLIATWQSNVKLYGDALKFLISPIVKRAMIMLNNSKEQVTSTTVFMKSRSPSSSSLHLMIPSSVQMWSLLTSVTTIFCLEWLGMVVILHIWKAATTSQRVNGGPSLQWSFWTILSRSQQKSSMPTLKNIRQDIDQVLQHHSFQLKDWTLAVQKQP